jgi:hypothetical protein
LLQREISRTPSTSFSIRTTPCSRRETAYSEHNRYWCYRPVAPELRENIKLVGVFGALGQGVKVEAARKLNEGGEDRAIPVTAGAVDDIDIDHRNTMA